MSDVFASAGTSAAAPVAAIDRMKKRRFICHDPTLYVREKSSAARSAITRVRAAYVWREEFHTPNELPQPHVRDA
jgi:hypothetical protein